MEDDTPSCSLAEALEKQDLFINSTLAQMGGFLTMEFIPQWIDRKQRVIS